jgi:hypothetical protein
MELWGFMELWGNPASANIQVKTDWKLLTTPMIKPKIHSL